MKLITRNTDYVVRALVYMAGKKGIVTISELVKELNLPRPFMRKLMQELNKKGFVKSYKGINGGFRLARAAGNMFFVDVIEAFQGPFKLNECFFKKRACPNRNTCPLKKRIDSIERHVENELKSITIGSLAY